MKPRVVEHVGPADVVTAAHAALGLLAILVAPEDLELAARFVLAAAILDGVDGIVARWRGSTAIGPYLDSLADVASFAVAPAVIVFFAISEAWELDAVVLSIDFIIVGSIVIAFTVTAVLRLALYTAFDTADTYTEGVQSTLAATVIGAAILATVTDPRILLVGMLVFTVLMVAPIRYPDLLVRDALIMGIVHVMAVIAPYALERSFPWALLILGVAYLLFAPWLYWRGRWRLMEWKGNA